MWRAGQLAEQLATQILRAADPAFMGYRVVDVHGVAERLGVAIIHGAIPQDGRLVVDDGHPLICVQLDQPWVRERFTVAHELAHWALRSPGLQNDLTTATRRAFVSEETLCDTVAGAMLLPATATTRAFRWARATQRHTLFSLYDIATQTEVSLGTAAVRMRDLFGWRRSLLHFVCQDGRYAFDSEAGIFPWEEGRIVPTAETEWELRRLSAGGSRIQQVALPLAVDGSLLAVPADVSVTHERAIAFLRQPNGARRATRVSWG
jgi:Zn-dependent peptidase ImmA (M78 family)